MRPRCAACKKRITKGEPDLILRRMSEGNPMVAALRLVYHERCKDGALERIQGAPGALQLVYRTVRALSLPSKVELSDLLPTHEDQQAAAEAEAARTRKYSQVFGPSGVDAAKRQVGRRGAPV
jgi:hypothetical protein